MKINLSNYGTIGKVAMKQKFWNIELVGYFVVLLIAILFRFPKLGFVPLSNFEALLALDAINLTGIPSQIYSNQILLMNLTGILSYIFGKNEFLVRLLPAVVGCLLVITPYFFRKYFDKNILIFLSVWLAIDPGFVSLSRQVNSELLTILLSTWLVLSLFKKKSGLSGILIGLLFLCGSPLWVGIIPVVITLLLLKYTDKSNPNYYEVIKFHIQNIAWKKVLLFFGITIIFGSTVGFVFPSQFGNILNGMLEYIQGWFQPGIISFWSLIRSLLIYNTAIVLIGFIGLVWLIRNYRKIGFIIGTLTLINLLHLYLYPQRSVENLIWVLIPLLLSATMFIASHISLDKVNKKMVFIITGYGLIFIGFMSLISLKIFSPSWLQIQNSTWSIALVFFGMILILLAIFLVGWTISWITAGKSFLYLAIIFLGIYTISAAWNAAGLRNPYHNEMWWIDHNPIDEDIVLSTINNYSEWDSGSVKTAQIQVINLDYPSIHWALREYEHVEYKDVFTSLSNPQIIISSMDAEMVMVDSYRGQDFIWSGVPNWSNLSNAEWETWLLSRRIPNDKLMETNIILWIRNDLFPGVEN